MKTNIKKAIFIKKYDYLELLLDSNQNSNWADVCAKFLNNGYNIIQLTNLNLSDKEFLKIALEIRQLTSLFNSLLIIESRVDITQLSNADGIILNNKSINIEQCKKLLHDDILIGYYNYLDSLDYDFYLSDKIELNTNVPIYSKIKSEKNLNFYRMEKYDYNQFN